MPTVSKKASEDMFDLITEVTNYDFSKHSNKENFKNTAVMMLKMKKLTIDVGRPAGLTMDMKFLKSAAKGKPTKSDLKHVIKKQLKSDYVRGRIELGEERLRAINDWDYFVKTLK